MKKSCTIVPTVNLMPGVIKRSAVRMKNLKRAHVVMVVNKVESWSRARHGSWSQTRHRSWSRTRHGSWSRTRHRSWSRTRHGLWWQSSALPTTNECCRLAEEPRHFRHDACICHGRYWTYLPRRLTRTCCRLIYHSGRSEHD